MHADETRWFLLDKGPGKKWYARTVASPDTVYHRILPSCFGATAQTVFGDYAGVVVVNGYAAYQAATKPGANEPVKATLAFLLGARATQVRVGAKGRSLLPAGVGAHRKTVCH
ncbi:IS66 family transposase [Stigmatella ashevillensis]|uniref:IS66 family transposase n=1 Tax=Stigmatella ashevillensis TaxID=2995309 RepID=UPI00358DB176